jgi:hypothetical protein
MLIPRRVDLLPDLAAFNVIAYNARMLALIADRLELQNPGREFSCTCGGHSHAPAGSLWTAPVISTTAKMKPAELTVSVCSAALALSRAIALNARSSASRFTRICALKFTKTAF